MTKTYPISIEKFLKAETLIRENGGKVNKDNTFEVYGVRGRFEKEGGAISITVTKKPFLARWSTIEAKLDEFFS